MAFSSGERNRQKRALPTGRCRPSPRNGRGRRRNPAASPIAPRSSCTSAIWPLKPEEDPTPIWSCFRIKMSSNKMEMSLDDIIKTDRKDKRQKSGNGGPKKTGPKKAGVRKNTPNKKSPTKKTGGVRKSGGGGQQAGPNAATKKLVQKLVQKQGGANRKAGGQTRVIRKVIKTGISKRSKVIKKTPRTETVVVRRVIQQQPRPRPQQIVREVIVQEPVRRRVVQPTRRPQNNNRTRVVYVQQNRGGVEAAAASSSGSAEISRSGAKTKTPSISRAATSTACERAPSASEMATDEGEIKKFFTERLRGDGPKSSGLAAIETLFWQLNRSKAKTVRELTADLDVAVQQMFESEDYSASVQSASELFLRFISLVRKDENDNARMEDLMAIYKKRGQQFIKRISESKRIIARFALPFKILLHSYSKIVLGALIEAKKQGRQFAVFVTESQPDQSGKKMHEQLQANGIQSTLILDSAAGYLMERVDAVIFGAEGVMENGGIINKIGTLGIAIAARAFHKPVYVFTGVHQNQTDIPNKYKYRFSTIKAKDLDRASPAHRLHAALVHLAARYGPGHLHRRRCREKS
ncbi:EIF-2B GDP-GTP exchange factor subunit alpha [Aphelenchoides fujianensis]|nr:EIF-2B GDP-GTP exchange factor subunit alpha [Aphelenchoides fujianensis]